MHLQHRRHHDLIVLLTTIVSVLLFVGQQQGWLGGAAEGAVENQPGQYTVTRFVDGDTIVVDMNGHEEKIRMIGVDTPETHKPNTPVQCYGPAAAAYTKQTIGNRTIRLEADPRSTDRDRYGRLLRYIILPDGTNFDQQLIRNGYGFYYPYFPFTQSAAFSAAQTAAQHERRGVWGNCHPTPTDAGGWTSNDA